jgi:hypothetical protein
MYCGRLLWVALTVVVAATQAHAVPIERGGYFGGDVTTLPCAIRIDFKSAVNGPDLDVFNTIRGYIADSKDINKTDAWSWGKQGEFSLCVDIGEDAAIDRVFADLSALAAAPSSGAGGSTQVNRGHFKRR